MYLNMSHLSVMLLATVALCATTAARAEVKKMMRQCDGKLCPYYEVALTLPNGWTEDKAATRQYNTQMIVPKGKTFGNADALIYIKVSYKPDKQQKLSDFIRESQDHWKKNVPDAKISKLSDVSRSNSKPAFESYRYDNPSTPQQAFEMVSFGLDTDTDGNEFVLTVVMTGQARKALEQAEKSYQALLRAH